MKKILFLIFALSGLVISCRNAKNGNPEGNPSHGSNYADSLDFDLQGWYDTGHFPGFAVSIFFKDSILYQKGFGYSNLETKMAYTPHTIQLIASVSKTFIGVALMKAIEAGKLKLDEPINNYLPFEVVNPNYPDSAITIRHLAMHTAGINDAENYNRTYLFDSALNQNEFSEEWHGPIEQYNKNQPVEMGAFLRKILFKEGEWYSTENFYNHPPGKVYEYSNIGATLLAYIIERATGENYQLYTQKHILGPLQMTSSSWEAPQKENALHTVYYRSNFTPFPNYRMITYPDGGLYSSVSDLARYLQEMIQGYDGEEAILSKASFQAMMSRRPDEESLPDAICWDLSIPCCIGHAGNDFGTSTLMYFEPETGIGRILFANVSLEAEGQEDAFYGIFNDLFKYAFEK